MSCWRQGPCNSLSPPRKIMIGAWLLLMPIQPRFCAALCWQQLDNSCFTAPCFIFSSSHLRVASNLSAIIALKISTCMWRIPWSRTPCSLVRTNHWYHSKKAFSLFSQRKRSNGTVTGGLRSKCYQTAGLLEKWHDDALFASAILASLSELGGQHISQCHVHLLTWWIGTDVARRRACHSRLILSFHLRFAPTLTPLEKWQILSLFWNPWHGLSTPKKHFKSRPNP